MLPYSAVAMDYANYQRHSSVVPPPHHHHHHPGGLQQHHATGPINAIGMSIGGPPSFTHSWLVPPQDLCGMSAYNTNPSVQQPPIDSGHVIYYCYY